MRLVWLLLALAPSAAPAHPLDEVVQGAYLTLAPGEVQLELDVTPGPHVAKSVLSALDANGDRRIGEAEARTYAQAVLAQSTLTLDGRATAWRLRTVTAPPYENLQAASDTLKIFAVASRASRAGPRTLAYENRYAPARSVVMANVFVKPAGGWRYRITGQRRSDDGRRFEATYEVSR